MAHLPIPSSHPPDAAVSPSLQTPKSTNVHTGRIMPDLVIPKPAASPLATRCPQKGHYCKNVLLNDWFVIEGRWEEGAKYSVAPS